MGYLDGSSGTEWSPFLHAGSVMLPLTHCPLNWVSVSIPPCGGSLEIERLWMHQASRFQLGVKMISETWFHWAAFLYLLLLFTEKGSHRKQVSALVVLEQQRTLSTECSQVSLRDECHPVQWVGFSSLKITTVDLTLPPFHFGGQAAESRPALGRQTLTAYGPVGAFLLLFFSFNLYVPFYGSDPPFLLIFFHYEIVPVLTGKLPQILCG